MTGINVSLANPPRISPDQTRFDVPNSTTVDGLHLPVYVIHWDAPEWCASTVKSLIASTDVIVDLCVIDNGPPEASAKLASALPESVRLIDPGTNTGFTGAANLAVRDWLASADSFIRRHRIIRSTPPAGAAQSFDLGP